MQLVDNKQPINADITRNKNTFSKVFTKNWPREMFITDSVLKTNPWTCKIKDLNGEKIIGSFNEKELLRIILWTSYCREPGSYIRDKFKVVLDLSHYATKNVRTWFYSFES